MTCRLLAILLLLILLTVPASGVVLFQLPDQALIGAVARLKSGDFRGTLEAALAAPPGGIRDFLVGYSAARLSRWEEAVAPLDRAIEEFPLLADYALVHQATALQRLQRHAEAAAQARYLLDLYPDSPLQRQAALLLADALCDDDRYVEAQEAYRRFIERYPSGNDSVQASYRLALCREWLGDPAAAAQALRRIWLGYPASPVAEHAAAALKRLASAGVQLPPYTGDELFQRATTLHELKRYEEAVKSFQAIPLEGQPVEFQAKVQLKTAQSLYRARRYAEAEKLLTPLSSPQRGNGTAVEATFWLAKVLDRRDQDDDAVAVYLKLVAAVPRADQADNAIFEAALLRKWQLQFEEEVGLLKRLLNDYPDTALKKQAWWELAWASLQSGDLETASDFLKKLTSHDPSREKSLYWLGRCRSLSGDEEGARTAWNTLLAEFPLGYYAGACRRELALPTPNWPEPPFDLLSLLPLPQGFERIKALIALGLHEESRRELSTARRKKLGTDRLAGLARLHLEMDDYNGAYALYLQEPLRTPRKEPLFLWGLGYPLAFHSLVTESAANQRIPASLVYAVIRAESSYSPSAVSSAGAVGLMQLMPATAAAMTRNGNGKSTITTDSLTRPETNIRLGVRHLRDLLDVYRDDPVSSLAAYNAGSSNVNRWRAILGNQREDEFVESIPFGETREYVKKVLAAAAVYRSIYGLDSPAGTDRRENNSVDRK